MLTGGEVVDLVMGGRDVGTVAADLGVPVGFVESLIESPLRKAVGGLSTIEKEATP